MTEEIYSTSYKKDGRTFSGYVVAESWEEAEKRAEEKGQELEGKVVHYQLLSDEQFRTMKRGFGI